MYKEIIMTFVLSLLLGKSSTTVVADELRYCL